MNKKVNFKIGVQKKSKSESSIDTAGTIIKSKALKTNFLLNNIIVFCLYITSFLTLYYNKNGSVRLSENYLDLLGFFIIALFVAMFLSNKYNLTRQHELGQTFRKIYISTIFTLGIVTILLIYFNTQNISPVFVLSTVLIGLTLESIYFYLLSERRKNISLFQKFKISFIYLFADAFILILVLYFEIVQVISPKFLNDKLLLMFIVYFFAWFFSALTTHKFNPIENSKNRLNAVGLQLKFYILIISLISLAIFVLQIKDAYWIYFLEAAITYSLFSFILFVLLFVNKINPKTDEVASNFLKAYELKGPANATVLKMQDAKYKFPSLEVHESSLKQKLQFDYLKSYNDVFDFLDKKFSLKSFDSRKTFIINSSNPYNIQVLENNSYQMIVNLHELNDLRRINDYLRTVNSKLLKNGVFVSAIIPNRNRHNKINAKYQPLIADVLYFMDFIWKRVIPKLPLLRKFYFLIGKGKDRAISLAEGLGRLVYNGFEIFDLQEIDNIVYFAVVKIREASAVIDPVYSPIFKMKRVGKDSKTIYVYKFRTMHPYSEYIQDFVYNQNKLADGGKFKDDFRIPGWGRFFRKLWLDELPMLVNWFKGDLKLVGVRPISKHYNGLYSKDHQEMRKKFKPGLVPPFYADMPETIEEIENSERVYLEAYEKNPVKTDIVYFLKVVKNIVFRSKRSA